MINPHHFLYMYLYQVAVNIIIIIIIIIIINELVSYVCMCNFIVQMKSLSL